jgi:hypothetical protein
VEYQLVANISPVPPPPPIEKSAVPLADLATELIWDACRHATNPSSLDRTMTSLDRWSRNIVSSTSPFLMEDSMPRHCPALARSEERLPPQTPELFGAIGEPRHHRKRLASSSSSSSDEGGSDMSSPSTSSPGTPAGSVLFDASSKRPVRVGGLGLEFGYDAAKDDQVNGELPLEAMRNQVRRLHQLQSAASAPLPPLPTLTAEPSLAFRQFVKQILTATLLAPEDLVLAVRYIASLPMTSMLPPTTSRTGDSKASAIKAAPFKLVLGALMLANKVRSPFFLCDLLPLLTFVSSLPDASRQLVPKRNFRDSFWDSVS